MRGMHKLSICVNGLESCNSRHLFKILRQMYLKWVYNRKSYIATRHGDVFCKIRFCFAGCVQVLYKTKIFLRQLDIVGQVDFKNINLLANKR